MAQSDLAEQIFARIWSERVSGITPLTDKSWDESKYNRHGKGDERGGEFAPKDDGSSIAFVSPAIDDPSGSIDRDTDKAIRQLDGERHANQKRVFEDIDKQLGIESTHVNTVGVWSDGAENSLAVVTHNVDHETLKYATAIKAKTARQKDAIVFSLNASGKALLYSVSVHDRDISKLRKTASESGLEYHTIQDDGKNGSKIYVFDSSGSGNLDDAVAAFADKVNAHDAERERGDGEFLTNEGTSRSKAAAKYDGIIRAYEEANPDKRHYFGKSWEGVRIHRRSSGTEKGLTPQQVAFVNALFTRAAKDCGANTEGGHGFQPGNTCASEDSGGGDKGESKGGKKEAKPARPAPGQKELPFPDRPRQLPFNGVKPGRSKDSVRDVNPLSERLGEAANPAGPKAAEERTTKQKPQGSRPLATQPTVSRGGAKQQPVEDSNPASPPSTAKTEEEATERVIDLRARLPVGISILRGRINLPNGESHELPINANERLSFIEDQVRQLGYDPATVQAGDVKPGDSTKSEDTGKPSKLSRTAPIEPDDLVELNKYQKHEIKQVASLNTPEYADKMSAQYENLAQNDDSGRKTAEFKEKAALWAHYSENHDDTKSDDKFESEPEESFDELMPLVTSSASTSGGGPEGWDDVDSYTQESIISNEVDSLLQSDSFIEQLRDDAAQNVDADDVIRDNIEEFLEEVDWENLDAGQNDVANEIEKIVKELVNGDKKIIVGQKMSLDHAQEIRDTLGEEISTVDDSDKLDELISATIAKLYESADENTLELLTPDEVAGIIQIDEDEAIEQISRAYRNGEDWAQSLVEPKYDEAVENACDDDCMREAAESSINDLDSDELFQRGSDGGYFDNDDNSGDSTSSELQDLGVDDAASFVGAPDDTSVTVNNEIVEVRGSDGTQINRTFGEDDDGKYVHADLFKIGSNHKGKGAQIFGQMVAQARAAGFSRIETHAAGQNGAFFNGYYTWAAFGYDYDLDEIYGIEKVKNAYPDAETVQDVIESPGGRDFWYVYGKSMSDAKFDLSEGSRSMRIFQAYLNEKKREESL